MSFFGIGIAKIFEAHHNSLFEVCLQNEVSHNRHTLKVFNLTPINPYLGVGVEDPKKLLKITQTKFAKSLKTTLSH